MTCVSFPNRSIPGGRSQHQLLPTKSSGLISPEYFKLIFSVYLTTNYTKLPSWLYTNFNPHSHAFCSSVNQSPATFQEQPSSDYRAFISCWVNAVCRKWAQSHTQKSRVFVSELKPSLEALLLTCEIFALLLHKRLWNLSIGINVSQILRRNR